MAKIIILGPQCAGKTTLARALRKKKVPFPIVDEDEEMKRRSGGKKLSDWTDWDYKWNVLRPRIQKDIPHKESIVYLTSFFDYDLLALSKQDGFIIISLTTDMPVLEERNKKRVEEGLRDDAHYGWNINLPYHEELKQKGLVDVFIDTNRPIEEVARDIIALSLESKTAVFQKESLKRSLI